MIRGFDLALTFMTLNQLKYTSVLLSYMYIVDGVLSLETVGVSVSRHLFCSKI